MIGTTQQKFRFTNTKQPQFTSIVQPPPRPVTSRIPAQNQHASSTSKKTQHARGSAQNARNVATKQSSGNKPRYVKLTLKSKGKYSAAFIRRLKMLHV